MGLFNRTHNGNINTDPTSGAAVDPNQGNTRRDVEGGVGGAFLGHEYQKHHGGGTGPGTGTGAVVGGIAAHEYNKHHHNNATTGVATNSAGTSDPTDPTYAGGAYPSSGAGAGATGLGAGAAGVGGGAMANDPMYNTADAGTYGSGVGTSATGAGLGAGRTGGMTSNQPTAATVPSMVEARKLERSGKMENMLGTVLCSTTLKEKGLMKEQQAFALRTQAADLNEAELLEAQARERRGHAVGMGAHQDHLNPAGATAGVGGAGTGVGGTTY